MSHYHAAVEPIRIGHERRISTYHCPQHRQPSRTLHAICTAYGNTKIAKICDPNFHLAFDFLLPITPCVLSLHFFVHCSLHCSLPLSVTSGVADAGERPIGVHACTAGGRGVRNLVRDPKPRPQSRREFALSCDIASISRSHFTKLCAPVQALLFLSCIDGAP